jgi:deoxycytidine triphosphate deaminase
MKTFLTGKIYLKQIETIPRGLPIISRLKWINQEAEVKIITLGKENCVIYLAETEDYFEIPRNCITILE